jgi:hypothetical protein
VTVKVEPAALRRVAKDVQAALLERLAQNPSDSSAAELADAAAREERLKTAAERWKEAFGPLGAPLSAPPDATETPGAPEPHTLPR